MSRNIFVACSSTICVRETRVRGGIIAVVQHRNHMQTALMTIFQFTPEEVMEIRVGTQSHVNSRNVHPAIGSKSFTQYLFPKNTRQSQSSNVLICCGVCNMIESTLMQPFWGSCTALKRRSYSLESIRLASSFIRVRSFGWMAQNSLLMNKYIFDTNSWVPFSMTAGDAIE